MQSQDSTVSCEGVGALSAAPNLPFELLAIIFTYTVCGDTWHGFADSFASLSLSHVCISWRSIIQTTPQLWSIDLKYPNASKYFLQYAMSCGGSLCIISENKYCVSGWPQWLLSHIQESGVGEISIVTCTRSIQMYLRTLKAALPGLQWVNLHVQLEWGTFFAEPDLKWTFLRSMTIL